MSSKKKKDLRHDWRKSFVFMVPGDGFEPSTSGSTIQRSDQLSYPGKVVVAGPGLMRLQ